ncbi:hypothetical protein GDO86_019592 [Hymenochirus boettgeri]|uniref:Vitelline membrane outer layer 1-like protein n=1 Tax=Hymenochirus boettgeri TaxID=247094 RepID=A0A8T2ILG3_9PIPI|nr:hypothetical protein GDO86_019592 [Hymenochirus boettgeri]
MNGAAFLSILFLCQVSKTEGKTIFVSNGGQMGQWSRMEMCPNGTMAKGLSLRVEPEQGIGDDTSLNGIRLHCVRCHFPHREKTISSNCGQWGTWGPIQWCPYGFLSTFSLRVEEFQGQLDLTAANNIKFKCSDNSTLEGDGLSWGIYGAWSSSCLYGICGIRTKIQKPQGIRDDTSLNDVQFACCDNKDY